MRILSVHNLPSDVEPAQLAGSTVVVIDVLRATTTIVEALAAGASAVVPCLTVADARAASAGDATVLAGERGGLPIAGFDLGNSPADFTPRRVKGRRVVLTTTNGTRALLHCRGADRVLIGAFANLSAVAAAVDEAPRLDVVCAGTDGSVTEEDVLLAGALVERLNASRSWQCNTAASEARSRWNRVMSCGPEEAQQSLLVERMRASAGGRNLVAIGMEADIAWAAKRDRRALTPCYDSATGLITA